MMRKDVNEYTRVNVIPKKEFMKNSEINKWDLVHSKLSKRESSFFNQNSSLSSIYFYTQKVKFQDWIWQLNKKNKKVVDFLRVLLMRREASVILSLQRAVFVFFFLRFFQALALSAWQWVVQSLQGAAESQT